MKKRRRVDRSERRTAELARTLQKENSLQKHKNFIDNYVMRQRLETAQRVLNHQNEYGALREALARTPTGLKTTVIERMKALGDALTQAKAKYPINFPSGPMP